MCLCLIIIRSLKLVRVYSQQSPLLGTPLPKFFPGILKLSHKCCLKPVSYAVVWCWLLGQKPPAPRCHGLVQEKGLGIGPAKTAWEVLNRVRSVYFGPCPTVGGLAGTCNPRPTPMPTALEARVVPTACVVKSSQGVTVHATVWESWSEQTRHYSQAVSTWERGHIYKGKNCIALTGFFVREWSCLGKKSLRTVLAKASVYRSIYLTF